MQSEMEGMAGRIGRMRKELKAALESRMPGKDWSFITSQVCA
jgi:aspartate aminotransferase